MRARLGGCPMRLLLIILAMLFVAPVAAQTSLYCVPNEPRVTAPDRLVSVEITMQPNGNFNSVLYKAANGASYDRGQQYDAKNIFYHGQHFWVGTLRINHNVGMAGSFYRDSGRLVYVETIHDNKQGGKVVSQVTSVCQESPQQYGGEATPPPPPAPASPTMPTTELAAFKHCVDMAAVALAAISNEPAQTVVDAALGECPKERSALENALERQGISQSVSFVDGIMKEVRPDMLALVLNTRATAARPPEEPTKSEPAKGQPL